MIDLLKVLVPIFSLTVVLFWLLPRSLRYGFLAVASIGMLLFLDRVGVAVLVGITIVFYAVAGRGKLGPQRAWMQPILILGILAYLLYFKYLATLVAAASGSSAGNVVVPLGISYFSFKLIHFVIESQRVGFTGLSFPQFCSYIFLFPIFTAGPIERLDHFIENQDATWQPATAVEGLMRIIHGLIKKFVLAHFVAMELDLGVRGTDHLAHFARVLERTQVFELWIFAILTYMYVYFDFSAYSDIAIGASRLFGIRIAENFDWPMAASNIVEFWQRWHITLRAWCQSYIYLPVIALSRNPYLAVYLTFVVMGVWHAGSWNYVCWGLYHATGVAIYQVWRRTSFRKRITSDYPVWASMMGMTLTNAFICGSHIWSVSSDASVLDRLKVLVKMFSFIEIG